MGFLNDEGGSSGVQVTSIHQAAQAAAKYINLELGGLDGRPLDITVCGTLGTTDGADNCAHQFVADGVSAVLVGGTGFGATAVGIVTSAGIPYIGVSVNSPQELTTRGAFILTSGVVGGVVATAQFAKQKGWNKIDAFAINDPAVVALMKTAAPAYTAQGVTLNTSFIDPGTPDITAQFEAALSGKPDAFSVIVDPTLCEAYLKAYQASGTKIPDLILGTCLSKAVRTAVGSQALVGAYTFGSADLSPSTTDGKMFASIMAKYAPGVDTGSNTYYGYADAMALYSVLHTLPSSSLTPSGIWHAFENAQDVPLPLGDGATFTCNGRAVPAESSVCSTGSLFFQVQPNGSLKQVAKIR